MSCGRTDTLSPYSHWEVKSGKKPSPARASLRTELMCRPCSRRDNSCTCFFLPFCHFSGLFSGASWERHSVSLPLTHCMSLGKLLFPVITPFLVCSRLLCNTQQRSRGGGKHSGEREGMSGKVNKLMVNTLRVQLEYTLVLFGPVMVHNLSQE